MIPADHITIDGDTAWLVCPNEIEHDDDPDWLRLAFWHGASRPCDNFCGDIGESCDDCSPTRRDRD